MGLAGSVEKERPYSKTDATLYYFSGRGLADQIRWLLAYSNVSFATRVIKDRERFVRLVESQLPFGQLPLLQIDDLELVQSQTIIRYRAKRANLVGASAQEEVMCDMIAETIRDLIGYATDAPFAKKNGRGPEHIVLMKEKWLLRASRFELIIRKNGGTYLVGKQTTYVDVLLAHCLTWFVEECGPDVVTNMPLLVQLQDRIFQSPSLIAFIQGKQYYPIGDDAYCESVSTVLGKN